MKKRVVPLIVAVPLALWLIGVARADPVSRAQGYLDHGKPRDAMLVLRNAVREHPQSGPANLMLARLDLELGSPVSAEREARAARAAGYQPDSALTLLLNSYLAQSRFVALLHDFPIGIQTGSTAARIAVARARANQALDRGDRETVDLNRAAAFDPNLPEVWLAQEKAALVRGDARAADQDLARAKNLAPNDPEVILRGAQSELASGNPQAALSSLSALVARSPSNIKARIALASALLAANKQVKATAQINQVLKIAPGSVGALYLKSEVAVRQRHWKQAESILQRLSPIMKDIPQAYLLQAETEANLGEPAAAQSAAEHYVARVPADPRGHRLLAALAMQAGHPHLAIQAIQAAGTTGRNDFEMTIMAGVAYRKIGDDSKARAEFVHAASLESRNPTPLMELGALDMVVGKPASAVAQFQAAAKLQPKNAAIQLTLGEAAIRASNIPVARHAIAALDQLKGPDAGAMLSAELDLAAYRLSAAKAEYQTALKADPKAVPALLGLAHIALLQGDKAGTRTRIKQAIKIDPTNQAAVSALASLLASSQDFTGIRAVLDAAHKAAPDNPVFIADLASLDIRTHQLDYAHSMLEAVRPALQNNPMILSTKTQVAFAQHDMAAAKTSLGALIALRPKNTTARIGLARIQAIGGDFKAAQATIDAGLTANPHELSLMEADVGLTLKQDGIASALAAAHRLASNPAHLPEAAILPGRLYLVEHQPKLALAAFQNAMQTSPSALLALNLAQVQAATDDRTGAAATLKQAITMFGSNDALEDAAGGLALALNDLTAATAHYQAALDKTPKDAIALNNLAWISSKQGKPDAISLAIHAYAISPTPQIADTLGWLLFKGKRPDEAVVLLSQAHKGLPKDPSIVYHYASALAASGDKAQAAALLKSTLTGGKPFADRAAAERLDASLGKS